MTRCAWAIAGLIALLVLDGCAEQRTRVARDFPEPRIRVNPATGEGPAPAETAPESPAPDDASDRTGDASMSGTNPDGSPRMPALPPEPVAVTPTGPPGEATGTGAAQPDTAVVMPPPPVVSSQTATALPPPPVAATAEATAMPAPPVAANPDPDQMPTQAIETPEPTSPRLTVAAADAVTEPTPEAPAEATGAAVETPRETAAATAPPHEPDARLIRLGRFHVPVQLGFPVSGGTPEGPVRLLVDTIAGSATFDLAEVIAAPLSNALGIPVQVHGIGADTDATAAERLFVARPDANTLMLAGLPKLVVDDARGDQRYSGDMLTPIFRLADRPSDHATGAADAGPVVLLGPPNLPKARVDRLVEVLYDISLTPTVMLAAMRSGTPLAPGGPKAAANAVDDQYDLLR